MPFILPQFTCECNSYIERCVCRLWLPSLQGDSGEEQLERIEVVDADDLARQLCDIWEDYDAQGEDHASTVSRGALPLIIKRAVLHI